MFTVRRCIYFHLGRPEDITNVHIGSLITGHRRDAACHIGATRSCSWARCTYIPYWCTMHILQSIRALPCVFIAVFVVVLLLRRRNYIRVLSCSQGSRVLRYTRFFFVLFMLFYPDVIDTKRFVSSHCRRKKRWRPLMLSFPNGRKSRSGKAGVEGSRAENKSSRRASDETAREMKKVRKFQFTVTVTSCCN